MYLNSCPKEQQEWLEKNFGITKDEMPQNIYIQYILYELLGIWHVDINSRTWYYKDFLKDCWLSMTRSFTAMQRFQRMVEHLNDLKDQSTQLEYYELSHNFNTVLSGIEAVVQMYNEKDLEGDIDKQVKSLLMEIGIG